MKKLPKIYTAVFLGVLLHVAAYFLCNVGMASYCCGFNLYYTLPISYSWGMCLMIAAPVLWGAAIILGILGWCIPKLRKPYFMYMIVCYGVELAAYIGMFFIPTYWVIPLSWLDPLLYLLAIAVCAAGLWGRWESSAQIRRDRRALPAEEIDTRVEALHDKLNVDP